MPPTPSRRQFLNLVGRAGGTTAVYNTMAAMGLLPLPAAYAGPPALEPASGHGVRVVVLGAGIAGMTAAYELSKAGYDCIVIEGRTRPGGRNWTIRGGDVVAEIDGVQTCAFDAGEHMYFNAGPARIPHHHQAILGYCREFQVPLEVMVNDNRATFLQSDDAFGGKPVPLRAVMHDTRGAIAELLAKAIDSNTLVEPISADDKQRMLAFVRGFGDLAGDNTYRGSPRAGFDEPPGAGPNSGRLREPLSFRELLSSDFWSYKLYYSDRFEQAATMLQPVGGMDRIATALARKLGRAIRPMSEVTAIRRTSGGVSISYLDKRTGKRSAIDAAYCVVTIPLKVLSTIDADFSMRHAAAIRGIRYGDAVKIAWQSRRFWETDYQIYGGISWVRSPTVMVWYPSDRFFSQKGILLGGYGFRDAADALAARPLAEQLELSRAAVEGLHPGHGRELEKGMAVTWSKVPYSLGIAARYASDYDENYTVLSEPDGPFYFAGEHLSHVGAWQEGALLSARHAINLLDRHRREQRA